MASRGKRGAIVQYTRRDGRNRNRIRTPTGVQWLTVGEKRSDQITL